MTIGLHESCSQITFSCPLALERIVAILFAEIIRRQVKHCHLAGSVRLNHHLHHREVYQIIAGTVTVKCQMTNVKSGFPSNAKR